MTGAMIGALMAMTGVGAGVIGGFAIEFVNTTEGCAGYRKLNFFSESNKVTLIVGFGIPIHCNSSATIA